MARKVWIGDRGFLSFAWCGFFALTAYLWLASWWFWPWYVTWVLPLAALFVGNFVARFTVIWSVGAIAAYVPITFRPYFWGEPPDDRMPFAVTLAVFVPPAIYAAVELRRGLKRRKLRLEPSASAPART